MMPAPSSKPLRLLALILLALLIAVLGWVGLHHADLTLLNPRGPVAAGQRNLMLTATLLMLLVVVPVYILTFAIAWKYRADNPHATYAPDWDHHRLAEFTWWAVPGLIILILAVITWTSSHRLDPARPLSSTVKPLTIQVVALPWKWLFIYPDQGIATVNDLTIPAGTPISFQITADAPMNSFWIPQLGGQIYAMAGMSTQLHLQADAPGTYRGSSANLSGAGFAGMNFTTTAVGRADFDRWIQSSRRAPRQLTWDSYQQLALPSQNLPVQTYARVTPGLYNKVVMKYMMPGPNPTPLSPSVGGRP